jgi:membrane-associated protease RseP (regulator of RpoE activity)
MRTFAVIAVGLALASGAAVTAASMTGQEPREPRILVTQGRNGEADTIVADVVQELSDQEGPLRQMAIFDGGGARLGISIRDLNADQQKTTPNGVVVEEVRGGSAAEKAGVKKGDVIAEFDGERVRSARQLSRLVGETADGRAVKTSVLRDGKRVELSVTPESGSVADGPHEFEFAMPRVERMPGMDWEMRGNVERGFRAAPELGGRPFGMISPGRGRLGVGIQDLTPQLAEYFGAKDGVLITSVEADSPAGKAGLKAGDVITSVNGTPVTEPSTVIDAVRSAGDATAVTIEYLRDKKAASTKATLEPRAEKSKTRRYSAKPI